LRLKLGLAVLAVGALAAIPSFSSTIVLGIAGDASVGADFLNFGIYPQGAPYVPAPGTGIYEVSSPVTSIFATNGVVPGEFGTIQSLNSTLEPAGTVLATPIQFMTFATTGSNLQIMMTEVLQGNLPSPPPSPFILSDTANGATAQIDFNGFVLNTTDNSETPISGLFSATFAGMTVAELLANLPVQTPFSGTVSLTTIPEPGSLILMGVGLLGAGLLARRKARS
jgi:hypothetical protein